MTNNRSNPPGHRAAAVGVFVGLTAIAAVALVVYSIARPDDGAWAFWAGLAALTVGGLITLVSRFLRRRREAPRL
jgi:hypothetical protein